MSKQRAGAGRTLKMAREIVEKDPTGQFSYNCYDHGLDAGCKCKKSGYAEQLEKAKGIVALRLLRKRPVERLPKKVRNG
jgi:hypothetical protein